MQSQKAPAHAAAPFQAQSRRDAVPAAGIAGPQQQALTQLAAQLHARPQSQALTALAGGLARPVQRQPNRTGIPDSLKHGVEAQSGLSLDGVQVSYNSPVPAQFAAEAVTQGRSVHIASGQERHLPHELGHVVQQMRGRVPVTGHMDGTPVNTDPSLEADADRLGAQALQRRAATPAGAPAPVQAARRGATGGHPVRFAPAQFAPVQFAKFTLSTKSKVIKKRPRTKAAPAVYKFDRPNFSTSVYKYARLVHVINMELDTDPDSLSLSDMNAAVPHRLSWENMRSNVIQYLKGESSQADLVAWTDQFLAAGDNRIAHYKGLIAGMKAETKRLKDNNKLIPLLGIGGAKQIKADVQKNSDKIDLLDTRIGGLGDLNDHIKEQQADIRTYRSALITAVNAHSKQDTKVAVAKLFLKKLNDFHPNVPDLGPHKGVNIQVSKYLHLNLTQSGNLTPTSSAVAKIDAKMLNELAVDKTGKFLPGSQGTFFEIAKHKRALPLNLSKPNKLKRRNVVKTALNKKGVFAKKTASS